MKLQDLNIIIPKIQKHFQKYPAASISAIYRHLRKLSYLSYFGDYPILATITHTVLNLKISIKRAAIKRAMRQSSELKGQRILLEQLLNHQLTIRKEIKITDMRRNDISTCNSLFMNRIDL